MKMESKFIMVGAVIVAILILVTTIGCAYILSNYDERQTDVYDLPLTLTIADTETLPNWESVAYKGNYYNFELQIYAADHGDLSKGDDIGGLGASVFQFKLNAQASPCKNISDVNIYLFFDGIWNAFSAKINGTILELSMNNILTIKAGELLTIPGQIVFNSVQRVYVGFSCESF
jgi:hypothetical protein